MCFPKLFSSSKKFRQPAKSAWQGLLKMPVTKLLLKHFFPMQLTPFFAIPCRILVIELDSLRLDSIKQILSFSLHIVRCNFLVILLVLWTACNCKFVHGRPELGCTKYTWKSIFNMPSSPSTSSVESWVLLVPFFILFPLSRELQKPRSHFVTHKRNEAQQNLHLKNNSEHLFTSLNLVHYGVDISQSTLVPDKYEL